MLDNLRFVPPMKKKRELWWVAGTGDRAPGTHGPGHYVLESKVFVASGERRARALASGQPRKLVLDEFGVDMCFWQRGEEREEERRRRSRVIVVGAKESSLWGTC